MIAPQNAPRRDNCIKSDVKFAVLFPCAAMLISACSAERNEQAAFMDNLAELCGNAYSAEVISKDDRDSVWRNSEIIIGPVTCERSSITVPLMVGENSAQSWVISPKAGGLSLKHVHIQHAHSDGSVDPINNYGGQTQEIGTAFRQDFPSDKFSRKLFIGQGLPASATNVWAIDIKPGEMLGYEMSRPRTDAMIEAGEAGRYFRMEVDISTPLSVATE